MSEATLNIEAVQPVNIVATLTFGDNKSKRRSEDSKPTLSVKERYEQNKLFQDLLEEFMECY